MAVVVLSLADGQLPATKGTIYTCPALRKAIVRRVTLVNRGAGANACNLYFKASGGTSRLLGTQDRSLAAKAEYQGELIITMEAGDILEGDATNAAEVDYTISGVETTIAALPADGLNLSAGTASNNLTQVVFSNSNGVSFGLNGSTVTASIVPGVANVVVSAGTSSGGLSSIVFSNSNNVSFGLNGSTITGSVIPSAGSLNFSAGTTSNNLTALVFSNSNGLSFGLNGSTVTGSYTVPSTAGLISRVNVSAGTTSNNLSAFTFSNANLVSFGLDAGTLTASIASSLTNFRMSAGTTSNLLSALTFADSNGVSFGIDAGTLTASVAAAGGGLTNIRVSAGTTSNLLSAITFSNGGGVTFGLDASTLTATVKTDYLTTARASNDGIGLATAQTNVTWTVNSAGLSLNAGGYAGTGFTTATTAGVAIVGTQNTAGLSLGVPAMLTTAMLSNAATISNIRVSAGTTSNLLSAITFSNSNGLTFGLNASVITGSYTVPSTAGLISAVNFSAGTTSNDTAALVFADSNGISFGLDNGTITASAAAAGLSAINLSAGTTSNNLTRFVLSNSNNVSFGLNGSTVTASASSPVQTNQTVGLYASSNTYLTSSGTVDARSLSFRGDKSITVGVSAGEVLFSVGAYLTTAMQSNAATISNVNLSAGTTSNNLSAFVFSNSGGVSFGLNGSTVTATVKTDYLTTAMQSNAVTLSNVNLSAGTTSNNLSAFVFSNSNGVSFGLDGSTVTASVVPSAGSLNFSAGTTSNNLTALVFSNSNNVSFGLNGSTVTATITVPAQTVQSVGLYALGNTTQNSSTTLDARTLSFNALGAATMGFSNGSIQVSVPVQTAQTQSNIAGIYDGANSISTGTIRFTNANGVSFSINGQTLSGSVRTDYRNNTDAVGLNTAQTNVVWTVNSSGISLDAGGYAGTGFTSTTTAGTQVKATHNTAGLSMAVPAFLTANAPSPVNFSAGTTSGDLGSVVFSNSNGVSFGLNGSTITGSVAAGGGGVTISAYDNGIILGNTVGAVGAPTSSIQAFLLPQNGSFSFLRLPVSMALQSTTIATMASATATASAGRTINYSFVVYSQMTGASSQSLGSVLSSSGSWGFQNSISITNSTRGSYTLALSAFAEGAVVTFSTQYSINNTIYSFTTQALSNFAGAARMYDIPFVGSLSPGAYWLAIGGSTSTTSDGPAGLSEITNHFGIVGFNHFGATQANSAFGIAGGNNLTISGLLGVGSIATAGGGTIATLAMSTISSNASNKKFNFQLLRSA